MEITEVESVRIQRVFAAWDRFMASNRPLVARTLSDRSARISPQEVQDYKEIIRDLQFAMRMVPDWAKPKPRR